MMKRTTPAIDACRLVSIVVFNHGSEDVYSVQLRQIILVGFDVYPWLAETICQSCITGACMGKCEYCGEEDDIIIHSEGASANPNPDKRDTDRVAKAEADSEVESIDAARVLLGRIRHGVMQCSRLVCAGGREPRLTCSKNGSNAITCSSSNRVRCAGQGRVGRGELLRRRGGQICGRGPQPWVFFNGSRVK